MHKHSMAETKAFLKSNGWEDCSIEVELIAFFAQGSSFVKLVAGAELQIVEQDKEMKL